MKRFAVLVCICILLLSGCNVIDNVKNQTFLPTLSASPNPVPTETPSPVPTETPSPVPTETPSPVPTETVDPIANLDAFLSFIEECEIPMISERYDLSKVDPNYVSPCNDEGRWDLAYSDNLGVCYALSVDTLGKNGLHCYGFETYYFDMCEMHIKGDTVTHGEYPLHSKGPERAAEIIEEIYNKIQIWYVMVCWNDINENTEIYYSLTFGYHKSSKADLGFIYHDWEITENLEAFWYIEMKVSVCQKSAESESTWRVSSYKYDVETGEFTVKYR